MWKGGSNSLPAPPPKSIAECSIAMLPEDVVHHTIFGFLMMHLQSFAYEIHYSVLFRSNFEPSKHIKSPFSDNMMWC